MKWLKRIFEVLIQNRPSIEDVYEYISSLVIGACKYGNVKFITLDGYDKVIKVPIDVEEEYGFTAEELLTYSESIKKSRYRAIVYLYKIIDNKLVFVFNDLDI